MPKAIIDHLRADFEAFNRTGEINISRFDTDFEMHQAASIVDTAGVLRGRNGHLRVFRLPWAAWDGMIAAHILPCNMGLTDDEFEQVLALCREVLSIGMLAPAGETP